ncbi:hypothetical protein [Bacillus cereus group sp. BfR-BA-01347]
MTGAYLITVSEFVSEKGILLEKDSKYRIDKITEVIVN